MKKSIALIFVLLVMSAIRNPVLGQSTNAQVNNDQITRIIKENYIKGVFIERDHDLIKKGFHKDFIINVRISSDSLLLGTLDMWLDRIGTERNDAKINYEILSIDVTGNSAMSKINIFENGNQLYTDYMLFYKFSDGWKIVSKIFEGY